MLKFHSNEIWNIGNDESRGSDLDFEEPSIRVMKQRMLVCDSSYTIRILNIYVIQHDKDRDFYLYLKMISHICTTPSNYNESRQL